MANYVIKLVPVNADVEVVAASKWGAVDENGIF
jgi:hypothetical protein